MLHMGKSAFRHHSSIDGTFSRGWRACRSHDQIYTQVDGLDRLTFIIKSESLRRARTEKHRHRCGKRGKHDVAKSLDV